MAKEITKRTHCNSRRVSDANVFDEKQQYVVYRFDLKPAKMKEDGKTLKEKIHISVIKQDTFPLIKEVLLFACRAGVHSKVILTCLINFKFLCVSGPMSEEIYQILMAHIKARNFTVFLPDSHPLTATLVRYVQSYYTSNYLPYLVDNAGLIIIAPPNCVNFL